MKSLHRAVRAVIAGASPRAVAVLAAVICLLSPTPALAAEGEHVVLAFDQTQTIGLLASLVVGVVALVYGFGVLRSYVLGQSPGDEKMQEVGLAIRQGALAYLRKQITTMSFFILLLFCGLVGLSWEMGPVVAVGVGLCFVCGVCASYISGYVGMLMAVAANMRTANAALTSYRTSFLVAFRSGAVAGLVTVGIGLIGASTILLLFHSKAAVPLLIGFGFGASLAALFMRVGGGIFTKAADVGADLVGKVEAGIPEDDPRNPAVIADNVGDNVGDCAGMAADVFESYEVTLVASIVLGAASAAIFDANTWPRLIVFGLAASAVGLLSSMIGIASVKGSDDPKSNPLGSLNSGFYTSAVTACLLIGVLAFLTMGGSGVKLQTTQLKPVQAFVKDETSTLKSIQRRLADAAHKEPYQIGISEILADPEAKALGLNAKTDQTSVFQLLNQTADQEPRIPDLSGLTKLDPSDSTNPVLEYATRANPMPGAPPPTNAFQGLGSALQLGSPDGKLIVFKIHHVAHIPPRPAKGNQPATTQQDIDETHWGGPALAKTVDTELAGVKAQIAKSKANESFDVTDRADVDIYASKDGRVALGVDDRVDHPETLRAGQDLPSTYFMASASDVNAIVKAANPTAPPNLPQQGTIQLAIVKHVVVPWWAFWLTISFGIAMAFAIQFLTDYYVSTHKAPTQEVAGVATAGAAPMVIQGFAHALTSSVFMVLAIVVALMFPLFVFNPVVYGGYTLSFYGIALVGIGLLTATAYVLAMDTFGPISDNAQGVFEMSGAAAGHPEAAQVIGRLDAAGNTTKALTKGFAIATAVVAAVALFHSYLDNAHLGTIGLRLDVPEIFLGLLIGGAAPYLFSSFALSAVGRASFELINEVRRQFHGDPGIMLGTSKPDYAKCVAIVTAAAQKELISPGILAIALPAAVGFGFSIGKPMVEIGGHMYNLTGAQALGGFLAGAIVSGQLMAVLLSNSGGMWDNAKKLIEDGLHGGKGTEAHKSAVTCDTVGDPFKDTAGPALNPLIKVMNLVGLLLSGVVVLPLGTPVLVVITVGCVAALAVSIALARRGSMSDMLRMASEHGPVSAAPAIDAASPVVPADAPVGKRKLFVEEEPEKTE